MATYTVSEQTKISVVTKVGMERRKHPRVDVNLTVRVKFENLNQFLEHYAPNLSHGGIFLQSQKPYPKGTRLRFKIQLKDGTVALQGSGVVVWSRSPSTSKEKPRMSGMGVKFIHLDESSREIIQQFIEKNKSSPPTSIEENGSDSSMELEPTTEEVSESATEPETVEISLSFDSEEQPPKTPTQEQPQSDLKPTPEAQQHPPKEESELQESLASPSIAEKQLPQKTPRLINRLRVIWQTAPLRIKIIMGVALGTIALLVSIISIFLSSKPPPQKTKLGKSSTSLELIPIPLKEESETNSKPAIRVPVPEEESPKETDPSVLSPSLTASTTKPESQPVQATLGIYSDPPSCSASLDGKELAGLTPIDGVALKTGKHIVTVTCPGHKKSTKKVQLKPHDEITLRFHPQPLGKIEYGQLRLNTTPWTEVFVGNKKLGVTPLEAKLRSGKHNLRLVNRNEGIEKKITVTIRAGKITRLVKKF